jgi:YD repeat-containing protein
LIRIEDGRGNTNSLAYVGNNLASVSDGLGRTLNFQYNAASGFLTNISDGVRSVGFTHFNGNLAAVRDARGFTTMNLYDPVHAIPGLLNAVIQPKGNVPYSQVYNPGGQAVAQTESSSFTNRLAYAGAATLITDPLGFVRQDVHAPGGLLTTFTDEAGLNLNLGYDSKGRRSSVTDRHGDTTQFGHHEASGRVNVITNADGAILRFVYSSRTNNGVVFHDLAEVTYPEGSKSGFRLRRQR